LISDISGSGWFGSPISKGVPGGGRREGGNRRLGGGNKKEKAARTPYLEALGLLEPCPPSFHAPSSTADFPI